MSKIKDTAWKAFCEERQNSNFWDALTYDDGFSALQGFVLSSLHRSYPIKEVLDTYSIDTTLYCVCSFTTKHLVRFSIDKNGIVMLKTLPVFGGINTPYFQPIKLSIDNSVQLKCIE